MGFIDKAKDAISHAADRFKDPDKDLVENLWPLGQPDDEHLPADSGQPSEEDLEQPGNHLPPVQGADPDLDDSPEDQYSEGEGDR
ncbi:MULTISPECIES: hypothetical protein [Actinomycetes]|uniref:hypothetical protein n=1 Tax=Actinomycetes TaxID=1760 RepID=UPI00105FA3F9|nr:hypothetical protein [Arthrobacter sp. JUb115]TDU21788.1 hypothetical protein EDF61_111103 [Arthrobacter sp. JUb115]